jgi:iron complex transport system substrate-binding protein
MVIRALICALLAGLAPALPAAAGDAPRRVVSMNLCTDQLAMMLAEPGQLISVSNLARDPVSSAMVDEAGAYPENHGAAEEVFLLKPDLVLAGSYTNQAATALLRRLGVRVEVLDPATSMEDVHAGILAVGRALGREDAAADMAARFEADLAALRAAPASGLRAALYYANGYSLGDQTLAGQILASAGFANVTAEAGLSSGGFLPLEVLIVSNPDLVIQGDRYPGAARAEELLDHPALSALGPQLPRGALADRDWICGTPHVLRAAADLRAAQATLHGGH